MFYIHPAASKEAITSGVGAFNKATSRSYEHLRAQEREQLKEKAKASASNQVACVDVHQRAASLFKIIRNQVWG